MTKSHSLNSIFNLLMLTLSTSIVKTKSFLAQYPLIHIRPTLPFEDSFNDRGHHADNRFCSSLYIIISNCHSVLVRSRNAKSGKFTSQIVPSTNDIGRPLRSSVNAHHVVLRSVEHSHHSPVSFENTHIPVFVPIFLLQYIQSSVILQSSRSYQYPWSGTPLHSQLNSHFLDNKNIYIVIHSHTRWWDKNYYCCMLSLFFYRFFRRSSPKLILVQ